MVLFIKPLLMQEHGANALSSRLDLSQLEEDTNHLDCKKENASVAIKTLQIQIV
jgi:hypothetical protein